MGSRAALQARSAQAARARGHSARVSAYRPGCQTAQSSASGRCSKVPGLTRRRPPTFSKGQSSGEAAQPWHIDAAARVPASVGGAVCQPQQSPWLTSTPRRQLHVIRAGAAPGRREARGGVAHQLSHGRSQGVLSSPPSQSPSGPLPIRACTGVGRLCIPRSVCRRPRLLLARLTLPRASPHAPAGAWIPPCLPKCRLHARQIWHESAAGQAKQSAPEQQCPVSQPE